MDAGHGLFSHAVTERVKASSAPLKLICIPGAMGDHWFKGSTLSSPRFDGIHVILCNLTKTERARCKSFATDTKGTKIVVQETNEPLHLNLP